MEGNKSIVKCCRAACFSAQQSGRQRQQHPCDAALCWVRAQVENRSSVESFHPSEGIFVCLNEPQLLPSVSGDIFPVENTAAKDLSHYNTPVAEQQGAIGGMTTPSFISDSKTESTDAKWRMAHWDMKGGICALQSEVSTNEEDLEQLCGKHVTATDIELERMKWDFVLAKLKYEHEDNEKQRVHEERMEQIHQQARERSLGQGLQDLLCPPNLYALFLYCFIAIHVIYTVKELVTYFFQTHYLFCFAVVLFFILRKIFQDYKNKKKCS